MKKFFSNVSIFFLVLFITFSTDVTHIQAISYNDSSIDNLMKSWQVPMGQYYYRYTPDYPSYVNGISVPDELLNHVMVNNQPVSMIWYEEDQVVEIDTYQVMSVFIEHQQNVVYIFTLYQGQPVALVNDQFLLENAVEGFRFSETANVNLKQRYDELYR